MAHRQRRQRASAVRNDHVQLSELGSRLERLAQDLPCAGLAFPDCLERWSQLFGSPLHPLDYLEQSAESLFRRYDLPACWDMTAFSSAALAPSKGWQFKSRLINH